MGSDGDFRERFICFATLYRPQNLQHLCFQVLWSTPGVECLGDSSFRDHGRLCTFFSWLFAHVHIQMVSGCDKKVLAQIYVMVLRFDP